MSRSTSPLRFDAEKADAPAGDGEARRTVLGEDAQLEPTDADASSIRRPGEGTAPVELLRWLARSLALLAVLSSFALLCVGATPFLSSVPSYVGMAAVRGWRSVKELPISGLPLLLAGSSYLVLQAILRPRPLELVKRVMLGIAFLLWGIVQIMHASDLAIELGNLVIALYVVDLGLIVWTDLQKDRPRLVPSQRDLSSIARGDAGGSALR